MVATSHGYAPQGKAFHNLLKQIPELYANGMPDWDMQRIAVYETVQETLEEVR